MEIPEQTGFSASSYHTNSHGKSADGIPREKQGELHHPHDNGGINGKIAHPPPRIGYIGTSVGRPNPCSSVSCAKICKEQPVPSPGNLGAPQTTAGYIVYIKRPPQTTTMPAVSDFLGHSASTYLGFEAQAKRHLRPRPMLTGESCRTL